MRTIHVSGGYSGTVTGRFAAELDLDLTDAVVSVLLVPVGEPAPSLSDERWLTPVVDSTGIGVLSFHFTVNESNMTSTYRVFGKLALHGVVELVESPTWVKLV